jgi:hypothetical protein
MLTTGTDRHRARRIAIVVLASAGAVGLSGCHEILRVTLGEPDPPVHNPPPAGRRSVPPAPSTAAAAAAGRAFVGKADGQLASRVKLRHGFVKSMIGPARFIGQYTSRLTGPPVAGDDALGPFESAQWHGQFSATRNRANGKITAKGLVLATFTDPSAGRACLRLGYRNARKGKKGRNRKKGTSTLKVLGGEGGAQTLAGTATVRVTIAASGKLTVRGRVKARRGPARGFTPACTKLEKKFGLTPLSR